MYDQDLFDLDNESESPQDRQPAVEVAEDETESGNEDEAEVTEETQAEEDNAGEEKDADDNDSNDDDHDDDNDDEDKNDEDDQRDAPPAPANATTAAAKAAEEKPVNVVEQDPYDFDKCLVTIALALMPDDGHPEGRPVMLGVRNHQDEPLMATCRLSDLMPLPDPVQQLIEQLKSELPGRSERNAKRLKEKAEQEAKLKVAREKGRKTPGIKPASAKPKKAEPASVNLFEMFDQQEVKP